MPLSRSDIQRNPLKIEFVSLNFAPEPTGVGRFNAELVAALAERKHEVSVVTAPPYYPGWEVAEGYRSTTYRLEHWSGASVVRCPLWVPSSPTGLKRLLHLASFGLTTFPAVLLKSCRSPAILLSVAPTLFTAPSVLLSARLTGARSWLHIQDFEMDAAFNLDLLPSSRIVRRFSHMLEGWIIRRFDRVSTISPAMLDRAAQKGVKKERLVLFPNWVDTSRIFPDVPRRDLFNIPPQKTVALYSGNLGRKQGLVSLLSVARLLEPDPDIHVVVCGEGSMRDEIERRASEGRNVQFLPLQPEEKLNALLNSADMHLLPELSGASDLVLPSKLTGMLASGKPVVASAMAGSEIDGMVTNAGFVVAPGDHQAMARAIRKLSSDPGLRSRLGRQARRYAEDHLSKDVIIEEFVSKLTELAGI